MRDRRAGPENGLFFPIRPNKMLWRMKGGDKPDVSPLFSVENGRCIRIPLPGLSNTQRFIDATITITPQRRFTDNDCTHCIFCLLMAGSRHPNAGRAQSAPSALETGFQCTDTRMAYLHTRLNDFTNDDETDDCIRIACEIGHYLLVAGARHPVESANRRHSDRRRDLKA